MIETECANRECAVGVLGLNDLGPSVLLAVEVRGHIGRDVEVDLLWVAVERAKAVGGVSLRRPAKRGTGAEVRKRREARNPASAKSLTGAPSALRSRQTAIQDPCGRDRERGEGAAAAERPK